MDLGAFEKRSGQFVLVVNDTLLTSCSRAVRLTAVRVLDQLYAALLEASRSEWERVKEATASVDALIERIRGDRHG